MYKKMTIRFYSKKVIQALYRIKFLFNLRHEKISFNTLISAIILINGANLSLNLTDDDMRNIAKIKQMYKSKWYLVVSQRFMKYVNSLNYSNYLLKSTDNNINQIASVLNFNHKLGYKTSFNDFQSIRHKLDNYHQNIQRCLRYNSNIQRGQELLWQKISLV